MNDPVTEAQAAFDRWHDAFNARDSAAMVAEMNFPHVRLTAANRFMEWMTADEFAASQDALTANLKAEGWHHTVNVSIEAMFLAGAWGFWSQRPWILPAAAAYSFYIALAHLIWNQTSPNGSGWLAGLAQLVVFSVPGILFLRARRWSRGGATDVG